MNLKYDPNNPLTDKQLDEIAAYDFDMFLEYLDSKTAYLKQYSKPLGKYHCKRFAALDAKMSGKEITTKLIKDAEKIGQVGDDIVQQRIIDKMNEKGWEEPDKMVKNVKTHRSQWFD